MDESLPSARDRAEDVAVLLAQLEVSASWYGYGYGQVPPDGLTQFGHRKDRILLGCPYDVYAQ